jgi:hypothetical protein
MYLIKLSLTAFSIVVLLFFLPLCRHKIYICMRVEVTIKSDTAYIYWMKRHSSSNPFS